MTFRLVALGCLLWSVPISANSTYQFSALRDLTKVLLYVKENYVEPGRVRPKEMFVASVRGLEQSKTATVVDERPAERLTVTANGRSKVFSFADVDVLWRLGFLLKDVAEFAEPTPCPPCPDAGLLTVLAAAEAAERLRPAEEAMIDGLLSTLDADAKFLRAGQWKDSPTEWCASGRTLRRYEFPDGTALQLPIRAGCAKP